MTPPNPPTLDLELDELDEVLAKHDRYGGRGAPYVDAGVLRKLIAAARELEASAKDFAELLQIHEVLAPYKNVEHGSYLKAAVNLEKMMVAWKERHEAAQRELAAANARIRELEAERDSYEEVALELTELGESVIRTAEGAMSSNDDWCEQADRFRVLAAEAKCAAHGNWVSTCRACKSPVSGAGGKPIRCDYGDACSGHATPDERPCGYDPSNYAHPEQPESRGDRSALDDAADAIAELCGCPEWEYPGQLVRDVRAKCEQVASLQARLAEREAEIVRMRRDVTAYRSADQATRHVLFEHGHCGDGPTLPELVRRALKEALEKGQLERVPLEQELQSASRMFPEDWVGSVPERVTRAMGVIAERDAEVERMKANGGAKSLLYIQAENRSDHFRARAEKAEAEVERLRR